MKRWIDRALLTIRRHAAAGRVRLTKKAQLELADLELGLDREDCRDVLRCLSAGDPATRVRSAITGEWMYVFRPIVAGTRLYLKLVLRDECVIISFHEEGVEDGGEDSAAE